MKSFGVLCVFLGLISLSVQQEANKPSGNSGSAARCYVCNENTDERCKDPFKADASLIKDCENGETFCRKIAQSVNGRTTIVRQCAKELYKPDYEGCYKTAGKSQQNVCTCRANSNSEPCNDGHKVKTSFIALVFSVVLSVFLLK